jgi:hypothetical protein
MDSDTEKFLVKTALSAFTKETNYSIFRSMALNRLFDNKAPNERKLSLLIGNKVRDSP